MSFNTVNYLTVYQIKEKAEQALSLVNYKNGEVDVEEICRSLNLTLVRSGKMIYDSDGNAVLGSLDFAGQTIRVNLHQNSNRERFTIAHEVGHLCLEHGKFLLSETVVENDLYVENNSKEIFNYQRLEFQANIFAAELLLPDTQFRNTVEALREKYGTHGRSFGYIFVDDQPCNYVPYSQMLADLSELFGVSRRAIEIKLKRAGLVTDNRSSFTRA
ncbi:ImmA/IrrE family metallo-endopeptidase [Roseinatronobacter ekhonensis]|uniref:ImmA/IrrE family metallo-endopeptidase n=1 Tax=Roseinatronobacter ekhonensis TaxID=254356 RepID=UPI001600CF22|nr:ImmA/IrrE family metallo-endopeptidase [Roseibaca ekhonensis]